VSLNIRWYFIREVKGRELCGELITCSTTKIAKAEATWLNHVEISCAKKMKDEINVESERGEKCDQRKNRFRIY